MSDIQIKPITVFISYSWDSEEHKAWVRMLADRLIEEGIEVWLDQYEPYGISLTNFMMSLDRADKVLIIGTPNYKKTAEKHNDGTRFQDRIINIGMRQDLSSTKYLPILREGDFDSSFTFLVKDKKGFDFRDDNSFETEFKKLLDEVYGNSNRPKIKVLINEENFDNAKAISWTASMHGFREIEGTYIGQIKGGEPADGEGRFFGFNGTNYIGTFKNGTFNGIGKIIWKSGSRYEGEFKDGEICGSGKIIFPYGTIFEGEFKDGCLNGQGKRTYPMGLVVEGEFKDGRLNGRGRITHPDGQVIEGEFKDDYLNEKGKISYPNGKVVEGMFKDGKLNGQGKITYPDGKIEKGEFKDGFLNGKGIITYSNGRVEEGEFRNGRLKKEKKK